MVVLCLLVSLVDPVFPSPVWTSIRTCTVLWESTIVFISSGQRGISLRPVLGSHADKQANFSPKTHLQDCSVFRKSSIK